MAVLRSNRNRLSVRGEGGDLVGRTGEIKNQRSPVRQIYTRGDCSCDRVLPSCRDFQRKGISDGTDVCGALGCESFGNPLGRRCHGYNSRTRTLSDPPQNRQAQDDRRHCIPFPRHESVPPPDWVAMIPRAAILLAMVLSGCGDRREPLAPAIRFTLGLPENHTLSSFAVSPDGEWVAYSAEVGRDNLRRILVRRLESGGQSDRELAGTQGGSNPFFSPDGTAIAYSRVGRSLARADVGGQIARANC